jgi:DNA (cytosine-5)-methyltransferase 1
MTPDQLRIRKLTPLECWRLMGIDDDDFYKAQAVVSNSQLYKQAGNGIIVDVFANILKGLIEDDRK